MLESLLRSCITTANDILNTERSEPTLSSSQASNVIQEPTAPATHVFSAVGVILGPTFPAWEPESIWLGLEDKELDVPPSNRDKILAVGTLLQVPAFYWDANLYEDTCLAFNGEPVIVDAIQEASPAQLAWGVFEAQTILMANGQESHQFDHDTRQYTALSLHHSGLVLAPALLVFCQDELDNLNTTDDEFRAQTLSKWQGIKKAGTPLLELELDESPLDVQIAKLAVTDLYLESRAESFTDLSRYSG